MSAEEEKAHNYIMYVCPKCGGANHGMAWRTLPEDAGALDSILATPADLDCPRSGLFTEDGRQIGITSWRPIMTLNDALRVEIHGLLMRPKKPAEEAAR